jgi:tripartite-type tricarboxylate transporter receptor subunit TctC
MFVGGHVGAKTLPELIEHFKSKPGAVPVATGAPGTYTGTLAAAVEKELGVTYNKVPYAGSQLFRDAIVAGTADVALGGTLPGTEDFVKNGQIIPIAVFAGQRLPGAPDLPTFAELGYPGLVEENFYGIYAPAGTPRAALEKMNAAISKVLASPEYADEMVRLGFWVMPRNLDELAAVQAADDVKLRAWLGK